MTSTAIGIVGLGNMGMPIMSRLLDTGHRVIAHDIRAAALDHAASLGAYPAATARDVADRSDTVITSLPNPQAATAVVAEIAGGQQIRLLVDMSTIGARAAQHNHAILATHGISMLDSPVSGGVNGAATGTLAIMVSGPRHEFDALQTSLQTLGHPLYISEQPGSAQTMKLINNLMAATTLAATAEVLVMGVKAGLDPHTMIDVLNAGSGATHASRDKIPQSVLPRTFDYGFATALMHKDIQLYLDETASLGAQTHIARAIASIWQTTLDEEGPGSDFTTVIKPMERAAGVTVTQ